MIRLLIIFTLTAGILTAQQPDKEGSFVKWMSLKEAMQKMETQQKPMLVDFYTDWCGWCKTMMKTTYANEGLSNYINTYFYPVKFDAESKDTMEFLGVKYLPDTSQKKSAHPLAIKLLQSKLMYPTTMFFNGYDKEKKEFKVSMTAAGYLEQVKLEPILVFVLENAGRNSSFDDFNKYFQLAFFDSTTIQKQKEIKWLMPNEAFQNVSASKKKTLVMINTPWCSSCKVMKSTSFIDTTFTSYLIDKFTLVDFNPEISDTIDFKGQKYYNLKTPQRPFHQLALLLGRNSIVFPSLIVLDENLEIIDIISSYITPHFLNDIIHYYGDDLQKTKSWQSYMEERSEIKSVETLKNH